VRVQLLDPSAYTPQYDHGLARGLAAAGADVRLITSRYLWSPMPAPEGFELDEAFYPRAMARSRGALARKALKLAEHVPGMLRVRREAERADVQHWQWLAVELLDTLLLPRPPVRVLTLHNARKGTLQSVRLRDRFEGAATALQRRLAHQMDAVVVHTREGVAYLEQELGLPPGRAHHIPHGALDYLTRLPSERPLPPELAAVEAPVVLMFGIVRPYKGLEVLLEAFRELAGAELWVVGRADMPMGPFHEQARAAAGRVRFVTRHVDDDELPALFRRADVVALPYRSIDQSGVLQAALAFGKPVVMSAVGGFPEVAEHGAGVLVPPGDPAALTAALAELLEDERRREDLAAAARAAAAGPYSWEEIGRRTLALYRSLDSDGRA
jgi:glycosyltransferase involved in cell wall biosynthesis